MHTSGSGGLGLDAAAARTVAALLVHELAPVRMLLADAADSPPERTRAALESSLKHLDLVCSLLPDILVGAASRGGVGSGGSGGGRLGDELAAACLFAPPPSDLEVRSEVAALRVPSPNVRIAVRNVLANASDHAFGARSLTAHTDSGGVLVTVVEDVPVSPIPTSPGSGLGLGLTEMVVAGCGGRLERRTSAGRFSGETLLWFPLADAGVAGPGEEIE